MKIALFNTDVPVPAKEYPRPTVKEILDFGAGGATWENLESFVSRFGYLQRVVLHPMDEKYLWSAGPVPENRDIWKREWMDIALAVATYSCLQGGVDMPLVSEERLSLTVSFGNEPGEDFQGHRSFAPSATDTDILEDARLGRTASFLRGLAAKLVSKKLGDNPADCIYEREGFSVVRHDRNTLLRYIWETLEKLFTGEIEARQCGECKKWEVKGDGYARDTWRFHKECGTRKRVRRYRRGISEEDFME